MNVTYYCHCWGPPSKNSNWTNMKIPYFTARELSSYAILMFPPDIKVWFQSDLLHGRQIFTFHIYNIFELWIHTQQTWQNIAIYIHLLPRPLNSQLGTQESHSSESTFLCAATLSSLESSTSCWCMFKKLTLAYLTNLRSCHSLPLTKHFWIGKPHMILIQLTEKHLNTWNWYIQFNKIHIQHIKLFLIFNSFLCWVYHPISIFRNVPSPNALHEPHFGFFFNLTFSNLIDTNLFGAELSWTFGK